MPAPRNLINDLTAPVLPTDQLPLDPRAQAHAAAKPPPEPFAVSAVKDIRLLLRQMVKSQATDLQRIAVTNEGRRGVILENWPPYTSDQRVLVPNGSNGGTYTLTANAPLSIVQSEDARLGGLITAIGPTAITLYLGSLGDYQANQQRGIVYLGNVGSSWNLRLGEILWAGDIVAVSTGASQLVTALV